jgi:zinc transport system substrate-binding protein
MKNKYVFVVVLLLGILVISLGLTAGYTARTEGTNQEGDDELLVVTSFYPMYIAAENIIGDTEGVRLENLSEPQTGCLHDFQLTPEDMRLLAKADVFVINGGGIETFMTDVAAAYPDLLVVNACEAVDLLESADTDDHDHAVSEESDSIDGDAEDQAENDGNSPDVNAHAWMSIAAYRTQVDTIAEKLMECDPKHASSYQANRDRYEEKLSQLQEEQTELISMLRGEPVILFHEAYAYVSDELGLDTCYLLNLDEESSISAGEVAAVIGEIKEHGIRLVLAEELYGSDMGALISSETDVQVLYLDTLNRGDYDADSYINGMRSNLDMLRAWIQTW